MQKSVMVIFVLLSLYIVSSGIYSPTGLQASSLPAPPSPPSLSGDSVPSTPSSPFGSVPSTSTPTSQSPATVVPVVTQTTTSTPSSGVDDRLSALERRVDALESKTSGLQQSLNNIITRPQVQNPVSSDEFSSFKSSMSVRNILSISLSLIVLLMVAGIVLFVFIKQKKEKDDEIKELKEYISQCRGQGYSENLIMSQLESSGWDKKLISEALK